MANYQLGPVIGQLGGGVEILTEQVEIGRGQSRTWELPDGWEAGVIALRGNAQNHGYSNPSMTIFGDRTIGYTTQGTGSVHGFGELPGTASTDSALSWSGTVTLIRTA